MTKRKIARTRRASKKRASNPIERAAKRAGIKPAASPDDRANAFIEGIAGTGQTLSRPALEALAGLIRENGDDNDLADAFARASAKPGPWELSGPAFDGEEGLRKDCTPADLFSVAYHADPHPRSFLRGAIEGACDDFELIEFAAGEEGTQELVRRCALRAQYRLKVAVEVERRLLDAEGGAS